MGLITEGESHDDDEEDSEASEEWNDIDDDDESLSDDDNHSISGRKSSVDHMNCISSPQGSTKGMTEFDFSNVNSNRRNPLSLQRISEDDEATLQDDDDAMDL